MKPGPLRFKLPPRDYQHKEFFAHRLTKARALFWSMRTGKSKATIDKAAFLWHIEQITGVIVLAPNIAHQNWILQEFPTHCPVPWEGLYYVGVKGRNKQKAFMAKFERICRGRDKLMVFAVNSESLSSETTKKYIHTFLKHHKGKVFFVGDEVHQFGAAGSKRTTTAKVIRNRSEYRQILSGTPIDDSPMSAYSEFNLLEPGWSGFTTFADFKMHFGVWKARQTASGQTYQQYLGPQNEEEFKAKIAPFTSVVTREEAGLLKPIDVQKRFAMTDEQRDVWKALKDNPVIDGKVIEGGVLMLKFQQISSGFFVDENRELRQIIPPDRNPRFILTMHEIRQAQGKVIVWCRFKYDIKCLTAMCAAEKIPVLNMFSEVPQKQKYENLIALRDDPGLKGIIGQPQSGGAGVDMRAADTMIWASHTSTAVQRNQASDRASAVGKPAIDLVDIVADNSNDDYILQILSNKENVADRLSRTGLQELLQRIGDG